CAGSPARLSWSARSMGVIGSEADERAVVRAHDVVAAPFGVQRRPALAVLAHAVKVKVRVDRDEVLVLARLSLVRRGAERVVDVGSAPGIELAGTDLQQVVRKIAIVELVGLDLGADRDD